MDKLTKKFEIKHVDKLKLSVNGAEMDVLKGAQVLINTTKSLAIEYYPKLIKNTEFIKFLQSRGFKLIFEDDKLIMIGIEWTVEDISVEMIKELVDSNPDDIRLGETSLEEYSEILKKIGQNKDAKLIDQIRDELYPKD